MKTKNSSRTLPKWVRVIVPSVIILIWLTLGSIGGPFFGKISEVSSNDQATFLPKSAESTKVTKELQKFQDSSTIPAVLVFYDDGKKLDANSIAEIKGATQELAKFNEVEGDISPPIVSDDGKATLVAVNISSDTEYKEFVPKLKAELDKANLDADYYVSGPVGFTNDLANAFSGIDGILLGVALSVVFIILLIVYRSPILPFIVLLSAIFALSAAILAVFYLAKADIITLNGQVQGILFILVVGAATDYALLYVARYKEELTRHERTYQAILTSWKRSFEPIVAAGGTVIAGLLCLLLSDLSSNKALGPVSAIGILMAILGALTFLPALLMLFGRVAFWPRIPKFIKESESEVLPTKGIWIRTASFIAKHARLTWAVTSIILLVACFGLFQLKADGVPQSDLILGTSSARDGQSIISDHFAGGSGTPAQIIASEAKKDEIIKSLDSTKGVASVVIRADNSSSGTMPVGKSEAELKASIKESIAAGMSGQPNIPGMPSVDMIAQQAYPFKNATVKVVDDEVLIEATLSDSADSEAAQVTIVRLRDNLHEIDSSVRIGGVSAVQYDVKTSSNHDRAVVIPAVLVVITLILMVLLRSILAPILLLGTTLLSFGATLGISALLFNHLWNFPGADPSVVLYGFIFLVALGIDYNIFLMTRVREESLKIGTRKGVLRGLIVTGGVITSAGIVLASTFAALGVIPILFLVQLAFIVAFGVLLDTIIVRSLLVPALVHDIGRTVWWPFQRRINH